MIAYNHYIKFIPELKNDKKVEGSFSDVVTVQESYRTDLTEKMLYEMPFFNNQGREVSLYTDREFAHTNKDQVWAFEIKGVMTFFWHSGTLTLEYIKCDNFTEELLEYWCLHIILPIFFTIEETYHFIHAGAVEVGGNPVLFIAESFGGKSTMTDFFIKKGHKMVSDDKVSIYENNGQIFALSSHPHHRPYRKMEDLGFFVENFAIEPKPISAIYELDKGEADADIVITELKGIEKFISLRYSSEMNIPHLKHIRFNLLISLAKVVPVYKIIVPWNIERQFEVYSNIVRHVNLCKGSNK